MSPINSVFFLGERTDVLDLLAAADVLVCSSRFEGRPLVCLEAIAAGLPLLLSSIAEYNEFRDLQGSQSFDIGDPDSLAKAIGKVVRLPFSRRTDCVQANKRLIESFDIERASAKYHQLYLEAVVA